MRKPHLATATAAVVFLGVSPAFAQAAADNSKSKVQDALNVLKEDPAKDAALFDFSYSAPASPVLPLVGVQADQITKVESFRKLGVSVLGRSESSATGQAVALDFSPYWLLARNAVSMEDYKKFTSGQKIAARAKGSIAVSEGKEAKTPSSIVFALSSKFLTAQDPLAGDAFKDCVKNGELWQLADKVERAGADALPQRAEDANKAFDEAASAKAAELKPAMEKAYKGCVDKVSKLLASRSSLDFGVGYRLSGAPGKLKDLEGSGAIVWGTYTTGVLGGKADDPFWKALPGVAARGVFHARYTFSEETYDGVGAKAGSADAALVAAGLESVSPPDGGDSVRWSLQAGWNKQDAVGTTIKKKDYGRYLAIVQARVGEKLWLNATVGRVEGEGVESDTYLLIGFSIAPSGGASGINKFYSSTRY